MHYPPLKYEGIKRSYAPKEKPIKFHEKTTITSIDAGDIYQYQKFVIFQNFMAMFDNEEEIAEVDVEKYLSIDLEKLGSLKDNTIRIIDYINSFDVDENGKKKCYEIFRW